MERFQVNYEGVLTAYYNDDKNITEITVPNNVKWIAFDVFNEYRNIRTVSLPDSFPVINHYTFNNMPISCGNCLVRTSVQTIIFRGVTFRTSLDMRTVFEMIRDKDYSCVLDHDVKYPVVLQIYFNDGDDVTTAYIKKNFRKFFVFLIDEIDVKNKLGFSMHIKDALNIIERLVKSGKFISKRNIETYVKMADEKECHEVFDMLNEYREENLK
ncbi:MAG: leucine-rich repeat domain-containing protein [Ruminococcus sp.]|nr:leucine-rich repeat domain-containing protein [Ruminococcus sp.]